MLLKNRTLDAAGRAMLIIENTKIHGNKAATTSTLMLNLTLALMILLCNLMAAPAAKASASNIYIAQSAAGAANGADCADAFAVAFFNNSANWGGGGNQIGAGTTVHLCGTMTFAGGTTGLTAHGSGTSGSPITIVFENGAILQAPNFGDGGAGIRLDGLSFITVDGKNTGIIQATLNGTLGGACLGGLCLGDNGGTGISAANSTNVTIQNLTIQDIYLRTSITDTLVNQFANFSIHANPATNLTINNNIMHDAGNHLATQGNNMVISNNDMYNMDHGLATGLAGTSYSGAYVFGNHIHDMAAWDAPTGCGGNCPYHHDGLHFFQNPGPGYWDGVYIYNNTFDGSPGVTAPTGWIFMEATCCTNGHVYVFNNTLTSGPESFPGEMGIYSGASIVIANNSVWGG